MPQPAILPCSPARGLRRGQCRDLQAAVSGALRLQRLRVQRLAVQVLEHHGQRLAAVVYVELAEERSEEHTSELQSHLNLVCRLLLEKKKKKNQRITLVNKHRLK